MDAAKLAIALRDVERMKIIVDRSPVMTKDLHDGRVQFDGFHISLIDAFKVAAHLDEIEKFLRELANESS